MAGASPRPIPPKKLSLGEGRAVMADGNEYGVVLLKEAGQAGSNRYIRPKAPRRSRGPSGNIRHCAASKCRTAVSGVAAHPRNPAVLRRFHRTILGSRASASRKPGAAERFSDLKLMKEDAAGVEKMGGRNQDALMRSCSGC